MSPAEDRRRSVGSSSWRWASSRAVWASGRARSLRRPYAWRSMNHDPTRRRSRRRTTLSLSLSLIVGMLAVATALAAGAKAISASHGGTAATLTYHSRGGGPGEPYSKLHLTIARRGRSVFDGRVNGLLCGTSCWPAVGISGNPVVRVADLEPGGSPDVILNLYSGGAHCCSITQVYRYDPGTRRYAIVQHDFADPGSLLP